MKMTSPEHYALSVCMAVATLSGCGGPAQFPTPAAQTTFGNAQGESWMSPDAKRDDLLYLANGQNLNGQQAGVNVYSWRTTQLVGSLSGFVDPEGLCVDKAGDVYVVDNASEKIVEYAHGGATPIKTLRLSSKEDPYGCSVDPTTGNLAVANGGNVLVYAHARGKPTRYSDTIPFGAYYVGYDGSGNLFADGNGNSYTFVLIELPKGKAEFKNIQVNPSLDLDGDVQWDGRYVVLANYGTTTTMYQFSIAGSKARLEGTTTLELVRACWRSGSPSSATGGQIHRARRLSGRRSLQK